MACRRQQSFCQKCWWQGLHVNTHTPLTQRGQSGMTMLLSGPSVGTYPEMSSCSSSGNIRLQWSQLAEPLWTDPSIKIRISVWELISTSKKKREKKWHRWGMNGRAFSQILASEERATTTELTTLWLGREGCEGILPNHGFESATLINPEFILRQSWVFDDRTLQSNYQLTSNQRSSAFLGFAFLAHSTSFSPHPLKMWSGVWHKQWIGLYLW